MKIKLAVGSLLLLGSFLAGMLVGATRYVPFTKSEWRWAIGIFEGEDPLQLRPAAGVKNPVLTAADVTDVRARFVADPFLLARQGGWYLFFEVLNQETDQGDIGLATSPDGLHWSYQGIVLDEPFHLSYPYVFEWEGEHYLVPESYEAQSVRLYRAQEFPRSWVLVKSLLEGRPFLDPTLFQWEGLWWMFASTDLYSHGSLRLYFAPHLEGPWREHPASPLIIENPHIARPAGRIQSWEGRLYRLAQDDHPVYGRQVWVFEILELTPFSYRERRLPDPLVGASGEGWNALGMHHVDAQRREDGTWLAVVDGMGRYRLFGWAY